MCKDWVHYPGKRNLYRIEIQSIDALSSRRGLTGIDVFHQQSIMFPSGLHRTRNAAGFFFQNHRVISQTIALNFRPQENKSPYFRIFSLISTNNVEVKYSRQ